MLRSRFLQFFSFVSIRFYSTLFRSIVRDIGGDGESRVVRRLVGVIMFSQTTFYRLTINTVKNRRYRVYLGIVCL